MIRLFEICFDFGELRKSINIKEEKAFAAGIAEKAKEFVATGGEIYHGNLPEGARRASMTF